MIVGNSDINELIEQKLRDEGFSADTIADLSSVVRIKGRPGEYELACSKKKYKGSGVIVTEQPYTGESALPLANALNLLLPGTIEKLKAMKGRSKAAILLDYCDETPEWLTVRAYEAAIELANAKKDVLFLSMFTKAASTGMEKLYLKARQAGVTFIKYERACTEFDEDSGVFTVTVNDGVFDTVIETPYLITAGVRDDADLALLGGKLKVSDKKEIVSEFKYFLNPALTTRKGVYYIHNNPDAALPYIINELKQIERGEASGAHAEVDSGKCAFCYSCYRACPHAALEPDIEAGAMVCVENACMACGVCAAICPGEAISMTEEDELSVLRVGLRKTEGSSSSVCKVFCCENSAAPAFTEIMQDLGKDAAKLSLSEIPCGGRLGREMIAAALVSYDKVLVAACMDGACRHMNGGKRACKQAERAINELEKMGLDGKKVKFVQVSHAMPKVLLENMTDFLSDN